MYNKIETINEAIKNFHADTELVKQLRQVGVPQTYFDAKVLTQIGKDITGAITKGLVENGFKQDRVDELLNFPLMEGAIRTGLALWCARSCNDKTIKDRFERLFQDKIELINMFITVREEDVKHERKKQEFKNRNNR